MKKADGPPALPECAARLADAVPRTRLHPAVMAWADACSKRTPWAVAFSGGADSLALLLLLWAHWPERRERLRALHFNHRLRGRASQADERFCAKVCAALGVNYVSAVWKDSHRGASEAEARVARMKFFHTEGRVLWLGHQQDDIAETMLMRLARGSGTAGLAAPRPVHAVAGGRVHLRPLLTLKKSELVTALNGAGGRWREDASNAGDYFFRNRVRHEVLPAWAEAAQRDALAGAAHARELLEEDDVALEAWLDQLQPFRADGALGLRKLSDQPRGLVRRALHRWLLAQPKAGGLSRQGFESLLAAVERGTATRHSLGREGFAVIHGGVLRFEPAGKPRGRFLGSAN
ncbi:MAG: tRNA lysidine(34) synthetase TilS [Verrucomicrobia bacterium]|nr:tRNA lysidine(34) synthetase TilS [Verrucomicrobiota bacterium]